MMIKIIKPPLDSDHPLVTKGNRELETMIYEFIQDPSSVSNFKAKSSIYTACKEDLRQAQHDKCCYCESPHISGTQHGDVEHFRPKGAVKENSSHQGYWWLMYEWENLFYSCAKCNQPPAKGTQFPLVDEASRANSPLDDLEQEECLLLNPAIDNLESHLGWREEYLYYKTPQGKKTIEVCTLNRTGLAATRKDYFYFIGSLIQSLIEKKDTLFFDNNLDLWEILNAESFDFTLLQKKIVSEEERIQELYETWLKSFIVLKNYLSSEGPYSAMIEAAIEVKFKRVEDM